MSLRAAVFITMATAISNLGHRLHLTAVPRSTCYIEYQLHLAGVKVGMSALSGGR